MKDECARPCACNKQIVWFIRDDGKGTIVACKDCEITFYYDVKKCPYCKKKVTEFVESD